MTSFLRDLRFAVRGFRRSPGFFMGALLVLALGVGANTAVFSLVKAVLLDPLPYANPEEVVMLWAGRDASSAGGTTSTVVTRWHDQSRGVLDDVAAVKLWDGNRAAWFDLVLEDRAERLRAGLVTPNFFTLLGADAAIGRVFTPADDDAGHVDLLVLSHATWQGPFGGDPAIVGQTVVLTTESGPSRRPRPYVVIGVLPPSFKFTYPVDTQVWAMRPWRDIRAMPGRAIEFNGAVGRLADEVTFEEAAAKLATIPVSSLPTTDRRTIVQRASDWVTGNVRPSMILLGSVATLMLLIACVTTASALLIRAVERERDLAVHASLGASRGRLVGQVLGEGMLLAICGTAAGLALATGLMPVLRSLIPSIVPRVDEMAIDGSKLIYSTLTALVVTLLAAVVPALHASKVDVATSLKRSSASASPVGANRWRSALVALQAAVASGLLIVAALLLTSFWRLGHVDLGFDGTGVVTVEMRLEEMRYFEPGVLKQLQRDLVTRVGAIPGVTAVGLTTAVPFRGVDFTYSLDRPDESGDRVTASGRTVDSAFFDIMRIGLQRGRVFSAGDTANSPAVAVMSESLGQEMFDGEDPIGRSFEFRDGPVQVIGVVDDVRYVDPVEDARGALYLPQSQQPSSLICLVIETSPGTAGIGPALYRVIHEVDPTIPVMHLTTIDQIVGESTADRRFYTTTTTAFAGLALLLTISGLAIVVTRSVVERRRELAIRTALGVQPIRLMLLVARQSLAAVAAGLGIGVFGAWLAASLLDGFLFQVGSRDPVMYLAVAGLMVAAGFVACLAPARMLFRSEPAQVLRGE